MKLKIIIAIFLLQIGYISAQDCYDTFNYYRQITVKANTDQGTIPAGTVAIPFNSKALFDAGKIAADGSNLRITNADCNEIPFFTQGISNHENNILYVSLPEIDHDGITLQLYYGSDEAQTSVIDGDEVFLFFDDFEDGEVDWTQWEVVGHEADILEEIDGELHFTGTFGTGGVFKYVAPKVAYTTPVTFDFVGNASNSYIYGIADSEEMKRIALRYSSGSTLYDTLDIIAIMTDTTNGGFSPGFIYPNVKVPRNALNIISISSFIDGNNHLNFTKFENSSTQGINTDTLTAIQMEFTAIRPFFASFGIPSRVEFIGIRPDMGAMPEITFGNEIILSVVGVSEKDDHPNITVFPNPANNQLKITGTTSATIEITNSSGKIIKKTVLTNQNIDISTLPSGIYNIQIITPLKPITKQFIKQ